MVQFLIYTWVLLVVADGYALVKRLAVDRRLGKVLAEERHGRRLRWLAASVIVLTAVLVLALGWGLLAVPLLAVLALCGLLLLVAPAHGDRVCGEDGVQVGWDALALDRLEEWRLTGDHLRFRLRGMWEAVPLPHALQAEVRVKLERLAPGRESPFRY